MDSDAAEARRQRLLAKKKERQVKILSNKDEERIPAALLGFHKHDNSENSNVTEGKIESNINKPENEAKQEEKHIKSEEQIPLKAKESEYVIQIKKEVKKDGSKFTSTKTQEERRNDGYSNLDSSSNKRNKYTPDQQFNIYTYCVIVILMVLSSYLTHIEMKSSILLLMIIDLVLIVIPKILIFNSELNLITLFRFLGEIFRTKQRYPFYFIIVIFTFLIKEYLKNN